MSFLRGCFMFIALILCGLNPAMGEEPSDKLAALQGTWKGTEAGREKNGSCTLMIEGNSLHFQGWNKAEWYKGTIKLSTDKNLERLQGTVTDCPVPEFVGKTSLSVYSIEDGKLTLVGRRPGDPEPPTGFNDTRARYPADD